MSDLTSWRIDELAHRSGVSVDTIRYYQREGLLEPPQRQGRTALYDAAHLARLEQVRDLQARHLSLAAIRSLLSGSRVSLAETLFGSGRGEITHDELAARSGLDLDLIDELETTGLLESPASLGRQTYDESDVRVLAAVRRLLDLGMPREIVVRLGAIYTRGFARMQGEVLDLFLHGGGEDLGIDLPALQGRLTQQVSAVLEPVNALLDYRHHRTLELMTLDAASRYEGDLTREEHQES